MKRQSGLLGTLMLTLLGAVGCEDAALETVGAPPPDLVTVAKPPPGGGPREIAFVTNGGVQAMAADGSNLATITSPALPILSVGWRPGGAAVAYYGVHSVDGGIFRVNADGTNTLRLLTQQDCGGSCSDPVWSPTGGEIAVIGHHSDPPASYTLLVVPEMGGPPQVLYTDSQLLWDVAWRSDGMQLALLADRGANDALLVLDRAGALVPPVPRLEFAGGVQEVDWARLGSNTVAFTGVSNSIWSIYLFDVEAPGATPVQLVQNARWPSFSPNNAYIVYQDTNYSTNLLKVNVSTRATTRLRKGRYPDWKR